MEYVDKKGKTYEISYSQKLLREQNKIARQKNQLLFAILILLVVFGIGALWIVLRMSQVDLLTKIVGALQSVVI